MGLGAPRCDPIQFLPASDCSFLLVPFVLGSHPFTRCLTPHKTASRRCKRIQQCDYDPFGFAALRSPTPPSGSSCVPPSLLLSSSLPLCDGVPGGPEEREREQVLLAINV